MPTPSVKALDKYGNIIPGKLLGSSIELRGGKAEIHGTRRILCKESLEFNDLSVQTTRESEQQVELSVHLLSNRNVRGSCKATIMPCVGATKLWSNIEDGR